MLCIFVALIRSVSYLSKIMKWTCGKSHKLVYFQVRESPIIGRLHVLFLLFSGCEISKKMIEGLMGELGQKWELNISLALEILKNIAFLSL